MDVLHSDLEAVERFGLGSATSAMKRSPKFSFTIPSLPAKNARTF
jgi:hypothetical protein